MTWRQISFAIGGPLFAGGCAAILHGGFPLLGPLMIGLSLFFVVVGVVGQILVGHRPQGAAPPRAEASAPMFRVEKAEKVILEDNEGPSGIYEGKSVKEFNAKGNRTRRE